MRPDSRVGTVRVLVEALRLSKVTDRVELASIALSAKASESFARSVLKPVLGGTDDSWVSLSPRLRIQLALDVARAGRLRDAARVLTWQEFEKFAEECLEEAGFEAERNVRVKGEGRGWQIDVVGFRGELVLAIDCKHWNTPGYLSRFRLAADHQRHAASHLLTALKEKNVEGSKGRQGLAVILTLREPRAQLSENTVLVSVEQLPSFLGGVTPYDEDLPFITLPLAVVENPMSEPS
jgi:Holliday junction resolvase